MIETITSRQNQRVKAAAALESRSERQKAERFAFEGLKLFGEAVRFRAPLLEVFAVGELADYAGSKAPEGCRVYRVTDEVYDRLSRDRSPDGIFCVSRFISSLHSFGGDIPDADGCMFLCVSVRDPGNIGTIIRSARAFGVGQLILSSDCADPYNIKTVRAAMGAIFTTKIHVADDPVSAVDELRAKGYDVCAAVLSEKASRLDELEPDGKRVFVVGNEGHGLDDDIISRCSSGVFIPMEPESESLNAAIAASILMWDRYRAR